MNGQTSLTTTHDSENRFHLRSAQVEPRTQKTQLTIAAAAVLVCLAGIHYTLLQSPATWLLGLSAVVVAMIASELGGRSGNRLGGVPGIWAALLFLLSPLQAATLQSASALPQMACTALYLLSVFGYLRFRSSRSAILLRVSLGFGLACFFTRAEAATLPLTITLAEILVPLGTAEIMLAANSEERAAASAKRLPPIIGVMLFWLVLFFALTAGQLAPHMVPVMEARRFFENPAQAIQSINIMSLLMPAADGQARHVMLAGYALCGAAMVMQSGGAALPLRILTWLVIFAGCTAGNASLTAAPLALGLSFAALPASGPVSRKFAAIIVVVGALGLTLVAAGFATESIRWVSLNR